MCVYIYRHTHTQEKPQIIAFYEDLDDLTWVLKYIFWFKSCDLVVAFNLYFSKLIEHLQSTK